MKIIAHRGARGYAPENTLAAFKLALEMNVDAIEFDVFVVKTGELVIIHDILVNRTTDGEGYVADFTFEDIRKLDAGEGQQIPTLQEVIELIDRKVPMIVELKAPGTAEPVAKVINEYLAKGWQASDFEVIGFNHFEIVEFQKHAPGIRTGVSMAGMPIDYAEFGRKCNVQSLMLCAEFLTPEFVQDAHASGMTVNTFTWEAFNGDTPHEVARIQALGVDGLVSDRPDAARSHVK
jgi:glycerophosphoryl diester phosphodiesterase